MINTMVQSAFVANASDDIKTGLNLAFYVRNETLNRAYATPGYCEMSDDEQKKIYDSARTETIAELKAAGIDW